LNFLNPVILLGLSLAALPIIIHFFTRTKSKTIKFGTLRFLKELQQKQIRRLKLRQWLLLLLRTLIIVLLVLGFARPSLKSNATQADAATAMAIIIDTSYSMEADAALFQQAKAVANQILSVFQPGDQLFILSTRDTLSLEQTKAFHSIDAAGDRIQGLEIQNMTLPLTAVVDFAQKLLLESNNVNKELFILSDFQETALADTSIQHSENIRTFAVPMQAERTKNLSIDKLEFVTTIIEKDKPITIRADLSNNGDQDQENALVQIFLNEQRIAQTAVDVQGDAIVSENFNFAAEKSGMSRGYLELEDDDMLRDNRYYFTFTVPEQIHVALFTETPYDARYLKMALDPTIAQDFFKVDSYAAARLGYTDFSQFDVVFISGVKSIGQQAAERLSTFVKSGGGLIVAVDENSNLDDYNTTFMPVFGLPSFSGTLGQANQNETYFSIRDVDLQHPIFSGFFEKQNTDITRPLYFSAAALAADHGVQPIITFSNNAPYLFEKSVTGRLLFFTSGFNKKDNDLPLRTLFAPLVTRCITYAGAAHIGDHTLLHIGDVIQTRLAFADASQSLEIFRPDGMYDRISANVQSTGAFVRYSRTDVPGIYTLEADGEALAQWAVNVDTKESRLTPVTEQEIQDMLSAQVLTHTENFGETIVNQRYGKEVWFYFILAAFLLLLMEMLVFREKKNKID